MKRANSLLTLGVTVAASLVIAISQIMAAGEPEPSPPKGDVKTQKKKTNEEQKKSEQQFRDGYRAAYALVQAGDYKAAFAAFKTLGQDDHPDVANYLGYTARKLGDYEASRYWYERALAADPKHVRTWQYYGMWHVEQGNKLKAQDFLETIRAICGGTSCKEYQDLKGGIEGTVSY
jgi:tetratricopeptide (TPR) repeat protein